MSNPNFIPTQDSKLAIYLENFFQVCDSNSTVLELSAAELTEIENARNEFILDLQNAEVARKAYSAAIETKDVQRAQSVGVVRKYAKNFKGNPNVSEALLTALGVINPSQSGPIRTVNNLAVIGMSDGVNRVTFDRTGNSRGTTFIIEYANSIQGPWFLAGAITRTRFGHPGNVVGQQRFYRVTSSRAGEVSPATPPVVVYPGGISGNELLNIAA